MEAVLGDYTILVADDWPTTGFDFFLFNGESDYRPDEYYVPLLGLDQPCLFLSWSFMIKAVVFFLSARLFGRISISPTFYCF